MENKIIITKDAIVKVRSVEKGILTGFDIIKECLIQIPNIGYIEITEPIISLLGNEENRLKLASSLFFKSKDISKILNVNRRTLFRLENKYINQKGRKVKNKPMNLTKDQVNEIRQMNESGKYTQIKIGNKFKISSQSVSNICLKKGKYKNF